MEHDTGLLKIIRRKYLVAEVIRQLQEQISTGAYKIGSRLPTEPELMKQLTVSRTTVRDAIRVLANAGLLEVRPGQGTFVRAGSTEVEPFERRLRRASSVEIAEVHRLLAIETAMFAARRRTPEDLAAIQSSLEKKHTARSLGNPPAYLEGVMAFHNAIAIASKNTVLRDIYTAFSQALYAGSSARSDDRFPENKCILYKQRQLVQAIAEQDPEKAKKWTAESLSESNYT